MQRPDAKMAPAAQTAAGMLTETAYAKVNLALHVRARRPDGYHALESLFAFACDGDILTGRATPDGAISLDVQGPFGAGLESREDNLVFKAALALRAHFPQPQGAAITLIKTLPVASGIGGGSADAAATLRLLTRLWDMQVPAEAMQRIALSLGSDVPACLSSVTQLVRGRGEILQPCSPEGLAGKPMLLVNPGTALSTARIFKGWDGVDRGPLSMGGLDHVITNGRNDLEASAMAVAPVIADVLARLSACEGARLARMSGSGATCFALFDCVADRGRAAHSIRVVRPDWWLMETEIR